MLGNAQQPERQGEVYLSEHIDCAGTPFLMVSIACNALFCFSAASFCTICRFRADAPTQRRKGFKDAVPADQAAFERWQAWDVRSNDHTCVASSPSLSTASTMRPFSASMIAFAAFSLSVVILSPE